MTEIPPTSAKRFRVAFSFAGEKRDFVEKVADILAAKFTPEKILYDKYHKAEFSRSDLAFYLPNLYHKDTDLIVAVYCPDYEKKEWCGLEWNAIFDLIKKQDVEGVMLTRFGHIEGKGLFSLAGYTDLQHETPESTANLILERLAINEGKPRDTYLEKEKPVQDLPVLEDGKVRGNTKGFFNVPYNSKGSEYVGRTGKTEEIWTLLNQEGCASIGQAVSVRGFGGIGKTQLAVEYAHAFKERYTNGVFWLVADKDIDNQLLQIADSVGWTNHFDKTVNQVDVAKAEFLKLSECLIIFDNVEEESDIKEYFPKMDVKNHVLITSREKQASFRQIDLELLQRDESRELLQKIAGRKPEADAEQTELENILEILGDIPLAVELVGGYLAEHPNVTFHAYNKYLAEVPLSAIEEEFPDGSFTGHDRSIIRTLRINEKTINEKPLMVEILKVLGWSGSSSMGMSLLKELVSPENEFQFDTALGDAYKLRLIVKDSDSERYAIHRLIAKVIRHENPITTKDNWHKAVVERLRKWFDERKEDFFSLAEFESEVAHLLEWQATISPVSRKESISLTATESYLYWQRGNYRKSLQSLETALAGYEHRGMDDKDLLASIQNDIGVIYGELGDHKKALVHQEKARELRNELFGESHPSTANSYGNVGTTYGELGNHKKALEYKERALEIQQRLFGEKHPDTARSYNNVGCTYGELGDHKKGLVYKEKSLEIQKELLGEKHPSTATSYDNIGATYGELGDYIKALDYGEKALELRKDLFGENHPSTANSYSNVGAAYSNLGQHSKALDYLVKALRLRKELFGESHPATALSYNNVGSTYKKLGDHKKALEFNEKALVLRQELFGGRHPDTARSIDTVGGTYGRLGDHKKALDYKQQALAIRKELFGEMHPDTAISFNNVGGTYGELGDHEKALEHKKKALEIYRELFGEKHPNTILVCKNVILELRQSGNPEKAGRLAAEFLAHVPKDSKYRNLFEEYGRPYSKLRKKKRGRR